MDDSRRMAREQDQVSTAIIVDIAIAHTDRANNRQHIDSTELRLTTAAIRGRTPRKLEDRPSNFVVALLRFLRLHLNDIELLRAVEAEQQRSSFENFHNQQPSLRVCLLDCALVKNLRHRIETI